MTCLPQTNSCTYYCAHCRPSGIVVSDADCDAVGPGFDSRRRHESVEPQVLMRLAEGEERREALTTPVCSTSKFWGGTEPNRTVICMVLKAKANDNRKNLALRHDEFRGP
ncbi:hypothetical protein TNCV_523111 [Trichonephila clavipes]|nr:hypothetical protein TNCV_523111 [Trichonephila clavipes]